MAVIESGVGSSLANVGDAVASPLHSTPKPIPYGSLGHYVVGASTGIMAAALAANSDIFQFRWGDATKFALIQEVKLTGMYQLTGFTVGAGLFRLAVARTWTATGSGGTAVTLTGNNLKLRTSMGATLATDIRIATTAALGAGTKTYETQDVASYSKMILAAANTQVFDEITLWKANVEAGEHPIMLAQNEGIGIRATVPATGTWVIGIQVKWAEVSAL